MFDTDIRAIIAQIAMSAGTMIACACSEIVMAKHSSLGAIDPQMTAKYSPTLNGECQKAIKWADAMVTEWLVSGKFKNEPHPAEAPRTVVQELVQPRTHTLALPPYFDGKAFAMGLKVAPWSRIRNCRRRF